MAKSTPLTKRQNHMLEDMQNVLRALAPYYERDSLPLRSEIERLMRAMFIVNDPEYFDNEVANIMREYAGADDRVTKIYALGADIRYVLVTYIDKVYGQESFLDFLELTSQFEYVNVKICDLCVDIEFEFVLSELQADLNIACTDGELRAEKPVNLSIDFPNSVSGDWLSDGLLEQDIDDKVVSKLRWPAGYVPRKLTPRVFVDRCSTGLGTLDVTVTVGEKIKA